MKQFLGQASWQKPIEQQHHANLDDRKAPVCPHPCSRETFESSTKLMFHLRDGHCWFPKQPLKRQRAAINGEAASKDSKAQSGRKRCRCLCEDLEYVFVDEIADIWKSEHSPDLDFDDDEREITPDDVESTWSLGRTSSVPSLTQSTNGEEDDDSDDSEPIDPQFLENVNRLDLEPWMEVQQPGSNSDYNNNIDPALKDLDSMSPMQFKDILSGH